MVLAAAPPTLAAENGARTTVRFRLLDLAAGEATPAMVCITGTADGKVRLPPDGRVSEEVSKTDAFYKGIRYDADRNWIGPVRKTMGKGDNNDRAYVYEVRPSIPYWHEPVMHQTSGDFTIDLPAGRWRVAVEHGMEFVPIVEEFSLTGDEGSITKAIELERWVNLAKRGWWSGDVHVHHPSLEPAHREYLLHYAMAEDVHVVNLLEMGHHEGTDFEQEGFGAKFRTHRGDYWLVPGQEEPRSTFGHIIGLNTTRLVRVEDMAKYDFYDIVFRGIHEQPGALVGFAHFAWNGCALPRGFSWYVTTNELDFLELLQFGLINAADYYDYLNLGFRLSAAAGSDIPWGSTLGEVRTYVHTGPTLDIDAWYAGLKAGRTFVSNGPAIEFTVDGKLPGSEIEKAAGESLRIAARALGHPGVGVPSVLRIVGNEGVLKEVTNPGRKPEISLELDRTIDRSQWLVAHTVCDNETLAHTSPVYIVVDGRPTWCPKRGPTIIEKQLKLMEPIAKEFHRDAGEHGRGVHERLDRAQAFYADLRERILEMK